MKYKDFYAELINENPEVLLGKYPRWEHESYLFIGTKDHKGLIYVPVNNSSTLTHAILLRTFVKKIDTDSNIKTFGDITSGQFDYKLSGAIMPKQSGIDRTIISLWNEDGLKLKGILFDLSKFLGIDTNDMKIEISDLQGNNEPVTVDFNVG